jgi:hypothetical protein
MKGIRYYVTGNRRNSHHVVHSLWYKNEFDKKLKSAQISMKPDFKFFVDDPKSQGFMKSIEVLYPKNGT